MIYHIRSFLTNLIGSDFEESKVWAERFNLQLRPTKIDGEYQLVTKNLVGSRINVEIEDGKITAIRNVE